MSRVSQDKSVRAAVERGVAARRKDEVSMAYSLPSENPFQSYSRSLARAWAYGYEWAWIERKVTVHPSVWKPGYRTATRKPKEV